MVRTNSVSVLSHSETSNTAPTSQNGPADDKVIRHLYRFQTGFCVGHLILLAVTATTLSVYVSEHMQKTDTMATKTDDLEAQIKELQVVIGTTTGNEPADNDLEVRLSQLENDRATIQGDIDSLDDTLTQLVPDVAANKANIQTQETRLEKLEANIQALNTSIKNFESGNALYQANVEALNTSIINLESVNALHEANIQALNISINKLESDSDSESNKLQSLNSSIENLRNNATAMEMLKHDLNTEISLLKAQNNVTLSSLNSINVCLSEHESELATNSETVESLNTTLEQLKGNLKSQYDRIVNQSSQITDLEDKVTANLDVIELFNNSVGMLGANLTTLSSSINNQSHRLAELESGRALDRAAIEMQNTSYMRLEANVTALADAISTIEANNGGLDQLGLYKNETEALDSRLTYLEDGLNCTWDNWTAFSPCSATGCAEGTQYRERVCESLDPGFTGMWCSRRETEITDCNPCRVDGGWGVWSPFTNCCNGIESRARVCDSPSPSHGGLNCSRDTEEIQASAPEACNGDCSDINIANPVSGSYTIYPYGSQNTGVSVYCEFNSEGAWTVMQRRIDGTVDFYLYWKTRVQRVIQRRMDGSVDFYLNWVDYKHGFGNTNTEYWLGNDNIHQITSHGSYRLTVILTDWDGTTAFAIYNNFSIASETDAYRLSIIQFAGTDAGDSMSFNRNQQFSSRDVDNDEEATRHCAADRHCSGWWHTACSYANPNGVYYRSSNVTTGSCDGLSWYHWKGFYYSLKSTVMMIQNN